MKFSCAKGHPFTHRISAEPFSVRGMAVITHETTDEEDFVRKREENAHNKNRKELCGVEGKR